MYFSLAVESIQAGPTTRRGRFKSVIPDLREYPRNATRKDKLHNLVL